MAKIPVSVTIRSYQVGFGDCFLLHFNYADGDVRNLLIDFGTTGLPKTLATTPGKHMPRVADKIAEHCGRDVANGKPGKLHAVVATHRHQDHISGFATDGSNGGSGLIIKALQPDVVVQPWTEDPDAKEDATHATPKASGADRKNLVGFRAGLEAMHEVAAAGVAFAKAELEKGSSLALSSRSLAMLQFVGEDNVKNVSAVKNLIDMGHRPGAKAFYVNYSAASGLESVLPGVKVTVLGPPSLEQTKGIATMRSRDKIEFWQLLAGHTRGVLPLANGLGSGAPAKGNDRDPHSLTLPAEARWFARRLAALRGAQVFEIVTALDNQMNNTSVILLFEFGGRKLLFPGDAQLENWRYALQEVGGGAEAEKNVKLLSDIDFLKVGHHGSLNATPKQMLWAHLTRRKAAANSRLRTMMSTMPGKHPGKVGGIGEVPRKPLLQALEAETILANTDELKKSKDPTKVEWFQEVTIQAVE